MGISPARASALSVLVFGGPRSLTELAAAEQVTSATMSKLVTAMEAEGLVRRYPDVNDARSIRIEATAKARRILERGRSRRLELLERLLGDATRARDRCRSHGGRGTGAGARIGLNGRMPSGWVGILTCELHFPEAHSLKEKRHHLRSAKAQLQNRVGASVAEVDHHDVWQRARITAACVAREHREVERLLDEAERWLRGQEWEVALAERLLVDPED